jgi:murein endopeptidase
MNTLTRIADVHGAYSRRYPDAPALRIYDLSQKGGGRIPPHVSHRTGLDVDLPYVQQVGKVRRKATGKSLDLERTWYLIKSFVDTNEVKYIFMEYRLQKALYEYAVKSGVSKSFVNELFQYPAGRHGGKGIIRHEPGHATHYHVRFYPGPRRPAPTS